MNTGHSEYEAEILTSQEAGAYIRKSSGYIRANYKRLGIKAYRVGNQLRFRKSELDRWLEQSVQ
jgi:excisionase family DNA binding protein